MVESAPVKPKKSNNRVLLLLLLVIVAVGGGILYYSSHKSSNNSTTTNSSNEAKWATYKSDQYGIQFSYPNSWGKAAIIASDLDAGKHYIITFSKDGASQNSGFSVAMSMDSNDASSTYCPPDGQCVKGGGTTKSTVEKQLNSGKYPASDSSSYATISNLSDQKISSITVYQIVNLDKINVSAVSAGYQIVNTSAKCPANSFSSISGCVSQATYDTMNKVLKSIKSA